MAGISQLNTPVSSEDVRSNGHTESKSPAAVGSSGVPQPVTPGVQSERNASKFISRSTVSFRGFAPSVTRTKLHDLFSKAGEVQHIVMHTHPYAGHGAVMYDTFQEAKNAAELFDYFVVDGKLIRVSFLELELMRETNGSTKVFIKNVDPLVDEEILQEIFEMFGTVISCKLDTDRIENLERCGHAEFEKEDAAKEAIKRLDGALIGDRRVHVSHFISKIKREEEKRERLRRTVVVKNLSESFYDLESVFAQFGYISGVNIEREEDGRSKCAGSVTFVKLEDAASAIEKMNGYVHDGKPWIVQCALRNSEPDIIR